MRYVWKYFIDLHNKRSSNGFGINPLLYTDMYCYFKLIQVEPYEYELDLISELDKIALEDYRLKTEQAKPKNK